MQTCRGWLRMAPIQRGFVRMRDSVAAATGSIPFQTARFSGDPLAQLAIRSGFRGSLFWRLLDWRLCEHTSTYIRVRTRLSSAVLVTSLVGGLARLMFGLDIGVILGAEQSIQRDFGASDQNIERIVSWMMLGFSAGEFSSGWISARLGRRRSMLWGALLFVASSALCGSSWSVNILLTGRVILGFSVGVLSFTAPPYLAEIAPENIRGAMVPMYQLMITIGILLTFLSDTAFSYMGNWH